MFQTETFFFFFDPLRIKQIENLQYIYIVNKYSIIQIPIISFRDSSSLQFSTYNANGKQRKNWSAKYFINDRSMGSIAIKIFKEKEKREKRRETILKNVATERTFKFLFTIRRPLGVIETTK